MKVNQLGTLAIIGVVVSFTVAACSGIPTHPTATNPSIGDGESAASVNLSNLQTVGAVDETCISQLQTFGDREDETGAVRNADLPPVTCDSSAAADLPPDDNVVVSDPPMDSARYAHRLHR